MSKAIKFLKEELELINDKQLREFTQVALDNGPEYFWTAPASSSGKYHPPFARGEGGLIQHVKIMVQWGIQLIRFHCPKITDEENVKMTDIIVSAILLHDICKFGTDEEYNNKNNKTSKLKNDHGLLASQYISRILGTYVFAYKHSQPTDEMNNILKKDREMQYLISLVGNVKKAVESHMQQWGDKQPHTTTEKIVALADYCSSRNIGFEE